MGSETGPRSSVPGAGSPWDHLRPSAPTLKGLPPAVDAARVRSLPVCATRAARAARDPGPPETPGASRAGRTRGGDAWLALGLLNRGATTLEGPLRQALPGGQLRLSYQIQRDCITSDVVGLEALIRWTHPERGLLTPAEFLIGRPAPLEQIAPLLSNR